jgi:hypothetical protein
LPTASSTGTRGGEELGQIESRLTRAVDAAFGIPAAHGGTDNSQLAVGVTSSQKGEARCCQNRQNERRGGIEGDAETDAELQPDRYYLLGDAGSFFFEAGDNEGFESPEAAADWARTQTVWGDGSELDFSDGGTAQIVLGSEFNANQLRGKPGTAASSRMPRPFTITHAISGSWRIPRRCGSTGSARPAQVAVEAFGSVPQAEAPPQARLAQAD